MSVADVQVIEWGLTMGKQQGSIDSPPVKELGSKEGECFLVLVMKDHADKIVPRGQPIMFVTSRFVYEYADFTCSHVCYSFGKTKARITPRLRQESFPLAGDAGFRHCRLEIYQKRFRGARGSRRKLQSPLNQPTISVECVDRPFGRHLGRGDSARDNFETILRHL